MDQIKRFTIFQKANELENSLRNITNKSIRLYIRQLNRSKKIRTNLALSVLITLLIFILDMLIMKQYNIDNSLVNIIGGVSGIYTFFIGYGIIYMILCTQQNLPKEVILYPVSNVQMINDIAVCTYKPFVYKDDEHTVSFKSYEICYDLDENETPYIEAYDYVCWRHESLDYLHLPKKET